jgi:hypothetical protein
MSTLGILRRVAIGVAAMATAVHATDDTNVIAEAISRFRPSRPTAVMTYDVTYALLNIRLKRLANATLKATEGTWRSASSGEWRPACLIDFQVASPRTGDGSVNLSKRTVSVLTLPDLKILTYAKRNDEYIKPLFRKGRRMDYVEVYDFESGALNYRHHDLVTGTVETNLPGKAELARQSTEVAEVLQTLNAAYRDEPVPDHSAAKAVHFNVDGTVKTFTLSMKKGMIPVPFLSMKLNALHGDIAPEDGHGGRSESFSMWCIPFREFSGKTRDSELQKLAASGIECSMIPLAGEYSLFLGSLHCTLAGVCVQP